MIIPGRKWMVLSGLGGLVMLGIIAARPPQQDKPAYKNLKVLSKNISEDDLEYVMDSFNEGLGSNCLFCHPGKQVGTLYTLDYATDSLMNKRVAREMLRMTIKLNKKYFNVDMNNRMTVRGRIGCKTCHLGRPVPMLPISIEATPQR